MPAAFSEADEGFRPPGAEEQWSDSLYFGGGDGSGLAFYARIGRRPNEGRIEGAFGLWLPDGRFALAFGREPDSPGAEHGPAVAGPARFECVKPFSLWTVDLCATARLFGRAEDVALRREAYEEVAITGHLLFTAWHEPISFERSIGEGVAARHYEQPGAIAGSLKVGSEELLLEGAGMRDHSWGVRDWQAVPWWRWLGIVVGPTTFVMMNEVGDREGGSRVGGCLMRDGELAEIVSGSIEAETDPELGSQRRFTARARDERDREAVLEGEAVAVAPLRQRREGRLTLVNEGLTRVRWDGVEKLALSEFLVQSEGS